MKKSHMLWMVLACAIPLLIIFLLPVFGIESEYTAFIAIMLMFVAHLFMMGGHEHGQEKEDKSGKKKGDAHEHH